MIQNAESPGEASGALRWYRWANRPLNASQTAVWLAWRVLHDLGIHYLQPFGRRFQG